MLCLPAAGSVVTETECWLTSDIDLHPLLGGDEVRVDVIVVVTTMCGVEDWCDHHSHSNHSFFSPFFLVPEFPLFSCLLICCWIWNLCKLFEGSISHFYSSCLPLWMENFFVLMSIDSPCNKIWLKVWFIRSWKSEWDMEKSLIQ